MNRRTFCAKAALTALGTAAACALPAPATASLRHILPTLERGYHDDHIRDYLDKMRNFDAHYSEDVLLPAQWVPVMRSTVARLGRLQRLVGYGRFYILDFDEALRLADNYPKVGSFTQRERDFMEIIFYEDAARYGFYGGKPLPEITAHIPKKEVVKVDGTGNYLYRGKPERLYDQIISDVGEGVILTSGVRGVVKQFYLFLMKLKASDGNLSLASRSLAPPGYSFHGISDFDVGKIGFGVDNFTEKFTRTEVFCRLKDLGYVNLRYPKGNLLGVRFEPWHIKVREIA